MQPELLAPAGSFEALKAAVENGADSVYLGGQNFSARQSAANFDQVELQQAIEYAHSRGVKVYVTANTLLSDGEAEEAIEYLHWLYNAGVDAVIVQDLGLLHISNNTLPELELHASTQMTLHNSRGVQLVQREGIERVVLAREVSLADIKAIIERTKVEVETFVHGALCISTSGQCLMSSMIGGRSGNRGRCAQPCRMKYTLVERNGTPLEVQAEGQHLLSPRDLNTLELLPQLAKAGISAFKIEGRMKRPEYVAIVVKNYRAALDQVLTKDSDFTPASHQDRELRQVFNRDFTTGYYLHNQGRDLMSYHRPNNRGIFLGRIGNLVNGLATIKLEIPLAQGDGVEVWVPRGRSGAIVKEIWQDDDKVTSAAAGTTVLVDLNTGRPGDRVFKTYDAVLMEEAKHTYTSPREQRATKLYFEVTAAVDEPLSIRVKDGQGSVLELQGDFIGEKARKRPLTREVLLEQLSRLGNTPFALGGVEVRIAGEVMYPLSEINKLRQQAVEQLKYKSRISMANKPVSKEVFQRRLANYQLKTKVEADNSKCVRLAVQVGSLDAARAALNSGAQRVIIGGEHFRGMGDFSVEQQQQAVQEIREAGAEAVVALPRLWYEHQEKDLTQYLAQVDRMRPHALLAGNPGSIELAREVTSLAILGDYTLNVFNSYTAVFLAANGLSELALSPELTFEQIANLALPVRAECLVHGRIPLMISEHCSLGALLGGRTAKKNCSQPCRTKRVGLKDRINVIFPVETDQHCRMHIHNAKELCVIDDIDRFGGMGIDWVRILAREKMPGEVSKLVSAYRRVIDGKADGETVKQELEQVSDQGFTKGHYYRGVM